jgi:hypothetical protein
MSLKALTPLLDPVLGQNVELGLCVDMGHGRNTSVGALLFFALSFLLSFSIARVLSKHCSAP